MKTATILLLLTAFVGSFAQGPQSDRQQFIRADGPVIALTHVRVVDGTGANALEDQTIVISGGKIASIDSSATARIEANAQVIDLKGYTVLPGLVGMHDHMFFPMGGNPPMYSDMGTSFPRLYLALGVTTIRTTGSVAPYTDLEIKKLIDTGRVVGPKMHVTAPYLEGAGAFTPVMHQLTGADDARKMVNFWADQGATSFKAYMNITRDELRAAVEEAHKRGMKVTGHLCSIGYREAAEIGIDNLEHGLLPDSEFVANKQPDKCPGAAVNASLLQLDINGAAVKETIRTLVAKNVALTSTLPVFEAGAPLAPSQSGPTAIGAASAVLNPRMLNVMNTDARVRYLTARSRIAAASTSATLVRKSMDFERAFVAAGGLLMAGLDPTGNGGVVAGFGDLREVELLVEAGFTPLEAIKIASFNGAKFLG
ncbi:MAG TPA: amidohydrolase family protein, partial [Pyrinomonadaceae bacterium]